MLEPRTGRRLGPRSLSSTLSGIVRLSRPAPETGSQPVIAEPGAMAGNDKTRTSDGRDRQGNSAEHPIRVESVLRREQPFGVRSVSVCDLPGLVGP